MGLGTEAVYTSRRLPVNRSILENTIREPHAVGIEWILSRGNQLTTFIVIIKLRN